MHSIAIVTDALHDVIKGVSSLNRESFLALDSAIRRHEQGIHESGIRSWVAKNIAYAAPESDSLQARREMKDFYATFRHAGSPRKSQHGFAVTSLCFYQTALRRFLDDGDDELAAIARQRTRNYDFLDASDAVVETATYVPLGEGAEYYCITPFRDGLLLAVNQLGNISGIGPDGPFKVPELDVDDSVKSLIRTEDRWYLVGEHARNVYEFDDDLRLVTTHHPAPEGNPRVQSARTGNGFALFPYNDTIWLYDKSWKHTRTITLPHAHLASEPCDHGGLVYFRNANTFHQSSELLSVDAEGNVRCVCDGLDFAPKCCFVGNVCSWANRTSLYLLIPTGTGTVQTMFSLQSLNRLEDEYFAKGYDIVPCNGEYWLFFTMERQTTQNTQRAGMLRIDRASLAPLLEPETRHAENME